jgi:hypothetical protein
MRQQIRIEFVFFGVVLLFEKGWLLPGNNCFELTGEGSNILKKWAADVRSVFAGVEEEASLFDSFDDAWEGVEERVVLDLPLQSEDFFSDLCKRAPNFQNSNAKRERDSGFTNNDAPPFTIKGRIAHLIEETVECRGLFGSVFH